MSTNDILGEVLRTLWGHIAQMDSILALHPAAPGLIPGIPDIFPRKIVDVAKVNQQCYCLEQWTPEA